MTEPRPFFSSGVRWAGMVETALLLGLAGSWLGLLGSWHWLLDLFSHFRWQYLVVGLVVLVWAGWRKRRVLLAVAGATLLLNAGLIFGGGGGKAPAGTPAPGFKVRVVSLNVLTSNQDHAGVLAFLRQADADIIFLMEVDRVWQKALQPLLATHPHHLIRPRSDNFGLAVFSRLPPEQLKVLDPAGFGLGDEAGLPLTDSVELGITHGGHRFDLIGVHPVPPMGGQYARARDHQLSGLAVRAAQPGHPVLVVGDLNATPWSHGFRVLTKSSGLVPGPVPWKPTWRAGSIFAIPIDHALARPPLVITSRVIGPDVGSDHRPQIMEMGWME